MSFERSISYAVQKEASAFLYIFITIVNETQIAYARLHVLHGEENKDSLSSGSSPEEDNNDERAGWSRRTFLEVQVSYKLSANRKDVVFGVLSEKLQ